MIRKLSLKLLIIVFCSIFILCGCQSSNQYSEQDNTSKEPEITFTVDDYVGNVFQIVVKDLDEDIIATGSGFVFNKNGYFITNAHVMKSAYIATAIFNIKNETTKEFYTYLDIEQAYYIDTEKDFFIGKIENYSSIQKHYKQIDICTAHTIGERCYSIGYPNSSIDLQMNSGKTIKDISDLYFKLYTGLEYVGFTSYIAPGSSGGILVNSKGSVIGLTTMAAYNSNNKFEYGAAIDSINFEEFMAKADSAQLKPLCTFLHPGEEGFVQFWLKTMKCYNDETLLKKEMGDSTKLFKETKSNNCIYKYVKEFEGHIDEDDTDFARKDTLIIEKYRLRFTYTVEVNWSSGDKSITTMTGYYSKEKGIDDLKYTLKYTRKSGEYFTIECTDINYSENISLTLRNAKVNYNESSPTYFKSNSDMEYAKKWFNWRYEVLSSYFEQ